MGEMRYYLCPPEIIKPEDLPNGWGLLYPAGKTIRTAVEAEKQPSNLFVERTLLISLMRRTLTNCPHLGEKLVPSPAKRLLPSSSC
jgi:hypothetical protein